MRKNNNGLKRTLQFQEQYSEEQYHIQKNFYQGQANSRIYFILIIIGSIVTSINGLEDEEWTTNRYWKLILSAFQLILTIILIYLQKRAPLHTNKALVIMSVCHSLIAQFYLTGDLIQESHSGIHYFLYGEYFLFVFLQCLRTSSFLLNTLLTIFNRGLTVIVLSTITNSYQNQEPLQLGMYIAQFSLTGVLIIYFDYRQERLDRANFVKHMDDMVWRNTSKHIVNQSLIVSQLTISNQIELFSCNKKASTRFRIKSSDDSFTVFLKNMQLSLSESVFNSKIFEKLTFKKTFCSNLHDYLSIRHSQMLRDNQLRKAKEKSEKEFKNNNNNSNNNNHPNQQPLLPGNEFMNIQNLNNVQNLETLENYVRQFVFKPNGEGIPKKKNSLSNLPQKGIAFVKQLCSKMTGFFRNRIGSSNEPRQQFGVSQSLFDGQGKSQEVTPNNKEGQPTLTNLLDLLEDELPKDSVDVDILQCFQLMDGVLRKFRVSVFKYKGGRSGEKSPLLILCIDEMLKNDFKNLKEQLLESRHFINNILTFFSSQFKSQITLLNDHLVCSNVSNSLTENEELKTPTKKNDDQNTKEFCYESSNNQKQVKEFMKQRSSQESIASDNNNNNNNNNIEGKKRGKQHRETNRKSQSQPSNDLASEDSSASSSSGSPSLVKAKESNEKLTEICHLAKLITVKSLIQVNNYADCYRLKESKPLPLKISEFSISELILNSFYFNSKPILIYNSTYQLIKSDERRLIQVIFNILNLFMRDTKEKCIKFIVTDANTAQDPAGLISPTAAAAVTGAATGTVPAVGPILFQSLNQFNNMIPRTPKHTLPSQYLHQQSLNLPQTMYSNVVNRAMTAGTSYNPNNNYMSPTNNNMFNDTSPILFSEDAVHAIDTNTPTPAHSINRKTSLFNKKHIEKLSFQDQTNKQVSIIPESNNNNNNNNPSKKIIKSPNETSTDNRQLLIVQSYDSNRSPSTLYDTEYKSPHKSQLEDEIEDLRGTTEQQVQQLQQQLPEKKVTIQLDSHAILGNNSDVASGFSNKSRTEVLHAPRLLLHNQNVQQQQQQQQQIFPSISVLSKQETRGRVTSIESSPADLYESQESESENYCDVMYNENISHVVIQTLATHNNQISSQQLATNNNAHTLLERISEEDKQYNNDSNQIIQSIKMSNIIEYQQNNATYYSPAISKAIRFSSQQPSLPPPTCSNITDSLGSINFEDSQNIVSDEQPPSQQNFNEQEEQESPNKYAHKKGQFINSVECHRNQQNNFIVAFGKHKKDLDNKIFEPRRRRRSSSSSSSSQKKNNIQSNPQQLEEYYFNKETQQYNIQHEEENEKRMQKSKTEGDFTISQLTSQCEKYQQNKSFNSHRQYHPNLPTDQTTTTTSAQAITQLTTGNLLHENNHGSSSLSLRINGLKPVVRTTRFYSPPKTPPAIHLNQVPLDSAKSTLSQNEIQINLQLQHQQFSFKNNVDGITSTTTPIAAGTTTTTTTTTTNTNTMKWHKSNTSGSFRKPFWGQSNKGAQQKLSFEEFQAQISKKSNENSPNVKSQKSNSEILVNSKKLNLHHNGFSSSHMLTKKLNSLAPVGQTTFIGNSMIGGAAAGTAGITTSIAGANVDYNNNNNNNQSNILIEIQMDDESINFKSKNENEPILILATNEIVKLLGPNKKIHISENSISFHLYPNLEQRSLTSNLFAASEQFEELINLKELMNPKAVQTIQRIDRAITIDATRTCKTIYTVENKPNIFELVHENTVHSMLSLSKRDNPEQQFQFLTNSNNNMNNNNNNLQMSAAALHQKQLIQSVSRSRILTKTPQITEQGNQMLIPQDQQSHLSLGLQKKLTPPTLTPPALPLFNLPRISQQFQQKREQLGSSANLINATLNNSTINQTQAIQEDIKKIIPLTFD